jgi:purine-binding chemotaxis protein CheW
MEHAPSFGTQVDTAYILGMAKIDSGVKILLDIDRVLSTKELQVMEKAI